MGGDAKDVFLSLSLSLFLPEVEEHENQDS